ncbi:MAG: hypothetical protein DBY45_03780 [Clostridiales bacterium]|nr:MAG: hypothetical protein DBY45_03780 [Clostridiales bacterium]
MLEILLFLRALGRLFSGDRFLLKARDNLGEKPVPLQPARAFCWIERVKTCGVNRRATWKSPLMVPKTFWRNCRGGGGPGCGVGQTVWEVQREQFVGDGT